MGIAEVMRTLVWIVWISMDDLLFAMRFVVRLVCTKLRNGRVQNGKSTLPGRQRWRLSGSDLRSAARPRAMQEKAL